MHIVQACRLFDHNWEIDSICLSKDNISLKFWCLIVLLSIYQKCQSCHLKHFHSHLRHKSILNLLKTYLQCIDHSCSRSNKWLTNSFLEGCNSHPLLIHSLQSQINHMKDQWFSKIHLSFDLLHNILWLHLFQISMWF